MNLKKHFAYYLTLCLFSVQIVCSQDSLESSLSVDRISIVGNEQTKDFVILREMTLKSGSTITPQLLEYDKNRIYSLGLFNEVQLQVVPFSDTTATLVVLVSERWYIYPYPIFGIKDGDWGKLYFGLGVFNTNFRGRNEKLAISFTVGYDPSLSIFYRNPFLTGDGTYYLESRLSLNKIRNKSIDSTRTPLTNFDERHYTFMLSMGKRINISHSVWVSAGYEVVNVDPNYTNSTISPDGEDEFPIFGAGYLYDTRDVGEYPNIGTFARFTITKYGLPSTKVNIIRYATDTRQYVPLVKDVVVAGRVMTDIAAAGKTPSYNRVYLGYGERVRGHFNEVGEHVREGENRFLASAELHYTLMPPKFFTIKELPPAFGVWRFGIVASLFGDAGTVWFRGQPLALDRFIKGYGVGLNFLLPYSAVLRVELALNEVRRGEFILDLGSTF